MKLSVMERLMIASTCLPDAGDIIFLRVRSGLVSKLGLTAEEIKHYKVVDAGEGRAGWDDTIEPKEKEIALNEVETGLITDGVNRLNKEQKLTPNHITLYEKFTEEGKN